MKKFISLILCAVLVFGLCGCAGDEGEKPWIDTEKVGLAQESGYLTGRKMKITEIHDDYFFATLIDGDEIDTVKIYGNLPEDYCIGDTFYAYFNNLYLDFENRKAQADLDRVAPKAYFAGGKPVIYLYPETETEVYVSLDLDGKFTCTYPEYKGGWQVTASPDGTLTDADGQTYSYLYWEGELNGEPDWSEGFCIKGEDTAKFLENALGKLGLTRKEANEFIVYWLPRLQCNPYNVISFQTDAYTDAAVLNVTPQPDQVIRVFMAWRPSQTAVDIPPQTFETPDRQGFTVVEWGGTESE